MTFPVLDRGEGRCEFERHPHAERPFDGGQFRAALIRSGALRPTTPREPGTCTLTQLRRPIETPVLRLDARGRAAAARHIERGPDWRVLVDWRAA